MQFTIDAYKNLIHLLQLKNYEFCFYGESEVVARSVILRHDIDLSLDKAVEMAKVENELGVKATYFILTSTNFYNVFSKESYEKLQQIKELGHVIGLHFDEKRYEIESVEEMEKYILYELRMLNELLNENIKVISMHRPSKLILENEIVIPGIINSYSRKFFKDMKYVSDSRMHWRENILEIIHSNEFEKLHILTHPFWYSEEDELMEDKLRQFLGNAALERYDFLNDNFTNLFEVIDRNEIVQDGVAIHL